MKSVNVARTSIILAAFALVFLLPATCHAQAEVSPDCYAIDNTAPAQTATPTIAVSASMPAQQEAQNQSSALKGYAALMAPAAFASSHSTFAALRAATMNMIHHISEFMSDDSQADFATLFNSTLHRIRVS